ncbi:3263_t:CDS:1, partial [Gigaspora margarita]
FKQEETIKKLKEIKIIFWTACNIENNKEQNDRIKFYTVQRYNDMKENTTRMINSILNRRTDYINWKKICILDDVIVEESEIKTATRQYFQN